VTFQNQPSPRSPAGPVRYNAPPGHASIAGRGALVGVITALVALGVAQVVAAILSSPLGEPVGAVGELSINHTPPSVKNFAIRHFGSNDKTVLVWGIRTVLIVFAVVIGILALRKLAYGLAGLAVFAFIGVYSAISQPTAKFSDVVPTLVGAAVAAFAMRYFARLAGGPMKGRRLTSRHGPGAGAVAAPPARPPSAGTGAGGTGAGGTAGTGSDPAAAPPGGEVQPPAGQADDTEPGRSPEPAGDTAGSGVGPAWSVPSYRQVPVVGETAQLPDRRKFLRASIGVAAVSLVTYAAGSWLANTRDVNAIQKALKIPAPASPAPPLPAGVNLDVPGISSFITPNSGFYRVDTAIVIPEILPSTWQLRIHGMVARELVLTFDDLIKRPLIEDYITLCCVSNWVGGPYIGNAKWLGVSLRSLLQQAGIKAGADQLFCTSSDGFTSGTPVQTAMDGRDALLAIAMNDAALPVEHGFPARLVIPGLYGYVSACKWITDIEVTTYAANVSYWAQRGWASQAPIKTESRIDVPTGLNPIKAGKATQIAGVAWAQHKGIEAVEVRVGKGPWKEAQLASVPGIDTWRQWVYDWDASVAPGSYLVEARATDKTGYTQTSLQAPPEPNGASGYPSVQLHVVS
jgi:DMSO/TMAO reductase YedYZ molybdopterin-dependent catalytic subunit